MEYLGTIYKGSQTEQCLIIAMVHGEMMGQE